MPLILLFLSVIAAIILFFVYVTKTGNAIWIEKKWTNITVFILSLASLIISFVLMVNMAIYADEYGSSLVNITGGWLWLYADWIRLGLLFVVCLISGIKLIPRKK